MGRQSLNKHIPPVSEGGLCFLHDGERSLQVLLLSLFHSLDELLMLLLLFGSGWCVEHCRQVLPWLDLEGGVGNR